MKRTHQSNSIEFWVMKKRILRIGKYDVCIRRRYVMKCRGRVKKLNMGVLGGVE